jgi:hypothetical protein
MVKKKTTTLYVNIAINSFTISEDGCGFDMDLVVFVVVGVAVVVVVAVAVVVELSRTVGAFIVFTTGSETHCFPNKSTILSVSSLDISSSSIGNL